MSNNIAVNLKRIRKEKQITMDGLARQADVSLNTVVKIETGVNTNPKIETLVKVCRVLCTTVDKLIR